MADISAAARNLGTQIDDLPFASGTMRMGLSPLAPADWIEVGTDRDLQMAEKSRLIRERREEVLVASPGSENASREVLHLLNENLSQFHPTLLTGKEVHADDAVHPLEIAARHVQEDLCVLEPDGFEHRLTAGCVCFPSNWNLRDKLGRAIRHIHDPVPGFEEALAPAVDRFFARLAPGHLVGRLNWLIHDRPDLFQFGPNPAPPFVTPDNAGDTLWLRTERQVLQRLPQSGAVLFTIRTRVRRLREAVPSPAKADELTGALRAMPSALQAYRHMGPFAGALLAWLDRTASAGSDDLPEPSATVRVRVR
jgi:hypothetical protein